MDWTDKTILIAEDEDSNYLYLEAVLQQIEPVDSTKSGAAGP